MLSEPIRKTRAAVCVLNDRFADLVRTHPIARQLPLRFEPLGLASDLARLRDAAWETYTGKYDDAGRYLSLDIAGTDLFVDVIASIPAAIRMARLTRLLPGGSIQSHRDVGTGREFARIHVPVTTHESVEFKIGGKRLPMRAGEAWELDTRFPHEVHNRSQIDRVHLILDVARGIELEELLECGRSVGNDLLLGYFFLRGLRRLVAPLRQPRGGR